MNYNNRLKFPTTNTTNHALINDKRILIQRTVKRKIRPEPFPSTAINNGFKQTIIKTRLLEHLFMHTAVFRRSKLRGPNAKNYKCIVFRYQFEHKSMVFLPCMLDEFLSEEYVCRDCFQVYSLFQLKQRDLDPLPTFNPIALKPEVDPRTLPHYCVHFRAFYPEIVYFNEFESHLNNTAGGSIVDLSFLFGMFMTRMGEYHRKVTNYLNSKRPKTLYQIISYIISINLAIKRENQALSFLYCFRLFHANNKQAPLLDDKESFDLLLNEAEALTSEHEESNNKIITFEQLMTENISDEEFMDCDRLKIASSISGKSASVFRFVPCKSNHSKARKRKAVPTVDEMTTLVNKVVAATEVRAKPIALAASIKELRLLVLYYAPSRLAEFDELTKEVLLRTVKPSQ